MSQDSKESPIIEEVRRRRMEISAAYDHDLRKYGEHLMQLQKKAEYRKLLVSLPRVRGRRNDAPANT